MTKWCPDIEVHEEYGTRRENYDGANSSASVTLRCSKVDAYNVIGDLLGKERPYPFSSPFPLVARSASIEYPRTKYETDEDGQVIEYTPHALITVTYRLQDYGTGLPGNTAIDPETGDPITINDRIEPATEFLLVEPNHLVWMDSSDVNNTTDVTPLTAAEAPGKILYREKFIRTISGLSIISPDIFELRGHINDRDYFSPYLNQYFRKGCLLFTDPVLSIERTLTPIVPINPNTTLNSTIDYDRRWSISISLSHKNDGPVSDITGVDTHAGWNWVWRAKTGTWVRIFKTTIIDPDIGAKINVPYDLYPSADYSPWLWDGLSGQ